jgi:pentatricopeptide repeat protein
MIHLCAEMKEATKAMDLFTDMTERRGLMPTPDAYNALIHACASDRDYFTQAWKYATEMQQAGFPIGKRELNVLLVACGRTGELTRARLLIKHMLVCGDKSKAPNAMSYMSLFRAYANYRPDPKRESVTADTTFNEALQSDAVKLLPTMAGAQKFAPPRDLVEKQLTYEDIPLSQKVVLSKMDILPEARAVLTYLRLNHPEFVDTQLMNAYLDICMDQKNPKELQRAYTVEMRGFMDVVRDITVLAGGKEIKAPRILRNCYTFKTAVQSAAVSRKLVFGRRVIEDREQYKATIPPKNSDGTADVNIYHQMSEKQRRKIDSETELWILRLLAKCELLGEAKQRIAVLAPIYKWEWEDLQTVYTKAIQVEDEGTAAFVKQVTGKADVESRRLERHERRNRRWL